MVHPDQLMRARRAWCRVGRAVATMVASVEAMNSPIDMTPNTSQREDCPSPAAPAGAAVVAGLVTSAGTVSNARLAPTARAAAFDDTGRPGGDPRAARAMTGLWSAVHGPTHPGAPRPGRRRLGRGRRSRSGRRRPAAGRGDGRQAGLRRARSTAAALERRWGSPARVEPRVGEIPSPPGAQGELGNRGAWLGGVMGSSWDDPGLDAFLHEWRDQLIGALTSVQEDTVVATHFVAINTAVGAATGATAVTSFRPDYCSRTLFEVESGRLELVELGSEGSTLV